MGTLGEIAAIVKHKTYFLIEYSTGELARLYILNSHVFKYYMSPTGSFLEYPVPNNPKDDAKINIKKITDYDSKSFEYSVLETTEQCYNVYTNKITIRFDKKQGTMEVRDIRTNKEVLKETSPLSYVHKEVTQTLHQREDEFFFGGGMQNGRFTHKGEEIHIVNSNNWVDGGVTSPNPFYWSTNGYGILRNTWQPGTYDFGAKHSDIVQTTHHGEDFDAFFFINTNPKDILIDYYELTGQPIFMPEYAFYEAHLNAFNRDYWVKVGPDTQGAILYEDGFYYKCYQPKDLNGKDGILESLNGEKNYQFSARAMIGRYQRHDMPLGWFVPNDGYGCGYGQTDSLEGDIENLKQFADYARGKGVEVALWTECNLEPANPKNPKKGERDLNKEVGVAGVVALKCDVAWIGSGYSFGLSAVEKAANIFVKGATDKARTMIITVDGWAGTQRHAAVWSGDQTGGQWEYIRFHIPTYIGAGLSGIPLVGSDMDGIYGGLSKSVNIRDYQWKAFTPLQLNMDGWGKIPKTPFSFDEEAKFINRAYLKLKSMLMPYNYTIAHESIHGLPMIRAMFLEFPEEICAYTKDSQYQFMWGPYLLVAPVYQEKGVDDNDWVRNGVYLPDKDQVWIDFLTGEKYQGGKIWNHLKTPLWRIPIFIKDGAVIPMANQNNNPYGIMRDLRVYNIYPNGETHLEVYEDDGITSDYLDGHYAKTNITVIGPPSDEKGDLLIHIPKTIGKYQNIVKQRVTLVRVMASKTVEHVKVAINNESVEMTKVNTEEEFNRADNAYFFKDNLLINPYLSNYGGDELEQKFLLLKVQKTDVTTNDVHIKLKGFQNKGIVLGSNTTVSTAVRVPSGFTALDEEVTATSITLRWGPVKGVYYEIERDGTVFTNITNTKFTFEGYPFDSEHKFRVRSASSIGVSKWSYYIVISTKENPQKNAVKNIKVTCSIPCQPSQEVCKLTDGDAVSLWHTHWGKPNQADPQKGKVISLMFDLDNIFEIDRLEYTPREDAGNGTILQIQYRFSIDGKVWSSMSDKVNWEHDETVKKIPMHGIKMRFIDINILESIGGFGSGKSMLFYKKD